MSGVHINSVAAYHAELPKLSKRADAVLEWIRAHGPHTDRQVQEGMGFRERNAVQPRITELLQKNLLMEVGNVRCPLTGKSVRRVDIRRPRQMDLLS